MVVVVVVTMIMVMVMVKITMMMVVVVSEQVMNNLERWLRVFPQNQVRPFGVGAEWSGVSK